MGTTHGNNSCVFFLSTSLTSGAKVKMCFPDLASWGHLFFRPSLPSLHLTAADLAWMTRQPRCAHAKPNPTGSGTTEPGTSPSGPNSTPFPLALLVVFVGHMLSDPQPSSAFRCTLRTHRIITWKWQNNAKHVVFPSGPCFHVGVFVRVL